MNPHAPGQNPDPNQVPPAQPPVPPQPTPQGQPQPVAYDQQGRPLYLHPPQNVQQSPQMVYVARPRDPEDLPVPPEILQRHEESKKKYPTLNLSEGEYVISAVKRHPIGLLRIWFVVGVLMVAFAAMAALFTSGGSLASIFGEGNATNSIVWASVGVLYVLVLLGGLAATYVYENNRFFLTNESVIQEIQTSLFDRHEQTVSLSNIEDASYKQKTFIQTLFNYGTIRLSTEGDETTYTFDYVATPKKHIATLNNAVEAFKNGRPVD